MSLSHQTYTISPSLDSTIAAEIVRTGLSKRKHTLFFEEFRGELAYCPQYPGTSRLVLTVDPASVVCRDPSLNQAHREAISRHARNSVANAGNRSEINFISTRISSKPIRGFLIEGALNVRGTSRQVKLNVVLTEMKRDRLQIDGDTTLLLSDFEIPRPKSWFGLLNTRDEFLVRILLWGTRPDAT